MNRRSFFSIVAAAVVAPGALWAMVKRKPVPLTVKELCEKAGGSCISVSGSKSMTPNWRNYANTYTNVDRDGAIEKLRRAQEKTDWQPPLYDEFSKMPYKGHLYQPVRMDIG